MQLSFHLGNLLYKDSRGNLVVERSPCIRRRSRLNPRSAQTEVVKTCSYSSTAKCSAIGVSDVLGDEHNKWLTRVTVGVAR